MNNIVAISRVRNEEEIIKHTLMHVSEFADVIIILDDCSTDNTYQICTHFPEVKKIIRKNTWVSNPLIRSRLEGTHRTELYKEALKYNPEWIYVFDADEFAYFEDIKFDKDAYKLKLWDYYITPDDVNEKWYKRTKIGCEYREILMLFRPHHKIRFLSRSPVLPIRYRIETQGSVKHYGKAISVEEWERTCNYYINHRTINGFKQRWTKRIGKAVHTKSDFGNDLILWEERFKLGVPLIEK